MGKCHDQESKGCKAGRNGRTRVEQMMDGQRRWGREGESGVQRRSSGAFIMRQVISRELELEDIRTVYEHIPQRNRCHVRQISAVKKTILAKSVREFPQSYCQ